MEKKNNLRIWQRRLKAANDWAEQWEILDLNSCSGLTFCQFCVNYLLYLCPLLCYGDGVDF